MKNTNTKKIGRPSKDGKLFHFKLEKECADKLERICKFERRTYTSVVEQALGDCN